MLMPFILMINGLLQIPFADFLNHNGTSQSVLVSDEYRQLSEVGLLDPCLFYSLNSTFGVVNDHITLRSVFLLMPKNFFFGNFLMPRNLKERDDIVLV